MPPGCARGRSPQAAPVQGQIPRTGRVAVNSIDGTPGAAVPPVTPVPLVTSNPVSRLTAARAATHLAGALTVATAATLVPATTAPAATAAARGTTPVAQPWPGHPDRAIVRYRVRPGDTATGLAVRYHAWTAELL